MAMLVVLIEAYGSASEVVSTISVGMRSGRALQPVMQIAVEGSSAIG